MNNPPSYTTYERLWRLVILFWVLSYSATAQGPLSLQNLQYQYEPSQEIHLAHQIAQHPTESRATVFLEWVVANAEYSKYAFRFTWLSSYLDIINTATFSHLVPDSLTLVKDRSHWVLEWEVMPQAAAPILLLEVTNEISNNVYYFDLSFDTELNFPCSDLILRQANDSIPYFYPYVRNGTPVMVTSQYQPELTKAYLFGYNTNFDAALPPMARRGQTPSRSMDISYSEEIRLGEPLTLDTEQLYFIQTDTVSLRGISFRKVEDGFPKYSQAKSLLGATLYLSSRREQASMIEAPDPKTALDQFWLGAALQSANKARAAIRYYYRAITGSNATFTSYKEGWKSDQGMIMSIFGVPNEVYRTNHEERWVYRLAPNQREVTFIFDKIKNIFARQHYVLRRQVSYTEIWQDQIELWRKGLRSW